MRRGYLKGLVIGGIVGIAVGKMWKKQTQSDSYVVKSYNDSNLDDFKGDLDQDLYLEEFGEQDFGEKKGDTSNHQGVIGESKRRTVKMRKSKNRR